MADLRAHSSTSNIIRFTLKHATTGVGLTGLSSASSGLIIATIADNEATTTAYTVAGSTIEAVTTLGTFAAPTATKCRFKEVDATNHKGLYEFQFADARFSVASAKRLVISVTGATNLLDADYEIQLTQVNVYDSVRGGMTALPNAVPGASGGVFIAGTNAATTVTTSFTTTFTGNLTGSVGSVTGLTASNLDTTVSSRMASYTQPTGFLAATFPGTVASSTNITAATGVVLSGVTHTGAVIPTVTTLTGHTPQTGDSFARIGAAGVGLTSVALAAATSDAVIAGAVWNAATVTYGSAGTYGALVELNLDAAVSTRATPTNITAGTITTVSGNVVGSVASVTAGVTVTTNNDKTGYAIATGGIGSGAHAAAELNAIADATLDRNMATGTDSGTNSTAVRTLRQAARALRNKVSVAAGTATVTKEDDVTASWTTAIVTTAGNPISSSDPT